MYVKSCDVIHPKSSRSPVEEVIEIIYDGGEDDIVLAKVKIKNKQKLYYAVRWNGSDNYPLGFPASRGRALWFLLPHVWGLLLEIGVLFKDATTGNKLIGGK